MPFPAWCTSPGRQCGPLLPALLTVQEFYEDVNASNYLSRVRVPLMVVNAKDDPFIDGDHLPEQERAAGAPVRLVYHTYGGHCG